MARKRRFALSQAIQAEGYGVRVMSHPARVKGGLGTGTPYMAARVFKSSRAIGLPDGRYTRFGVAILSDSWDFAYCAAHEIAEHRWRFRHSADMFSEQANLLSRWIRGLA